MSEALKQSLKREVDSTEVTIASLNDSIDKAEATLADMKSRRRAALLELKRLQSALKGLEGRPRATKTEPAPPNEPEEVEVEIDADPEAVRAIEERNAQELRAVSR